MKKVLTIIMMVLVGLLSIYVCYSKEPVKMINPTGKVLFDKILKNTQSITITFKDKPHRLVKMNEKDQMKIIDLLCKADNIGFYNDNQVINLNPNVKMQVDTDNSFYLFYGNSDGKVYYDYFSLLDIKDDQQFLSVKRYYHINHNVLVQTDKASWKSLMNKLQNYKTYKENPNNRF